MDRLWMIVLGAAVVLLGLVFIITSVGSGGKSPQELPILAVVDYTSDKPEGADGIALVDLNPQSKTFGNFLQKYLLGPGVSPHHLYYNRDGSKLYTTALGGDRLYRIESENDQIKQVTPVNTGACQVGEDLYFTEDSSKFYLTCMGSSMIAVFDAQTEQMLSQIEAPAPKEPFIKHPHGLAVNESIGRMFVTETVSPKLDDPGASVTAIELSSGKILKTYPITKDGKGGSAPVEIFFLPDKPIAYITAMFEGSIWMLGDWDKQTKEFGMLHIADDLTARGQGVPLEMYIGPDEKLYVSVAQPGVVNVYDIADPMTPKLLKTLPAGAGAHHIVFHGDYMFVQNNLLNLTKLNAGTISVVDLKSGKLVATVDSFVKQGLKPASLVLLR